MNQKRKELEEMLKEMAANSELFEMGIRHSAHQLRVAYECLIEEGFANSEALEIIKERGTSLG